MIYYGETDGIITVLAGAEWQTENFKEIQFLMDRRSGQELQGWNYEWIITPMECQLYTSMG